jgi:hypothetical protein
MKDTGKMAYLRLLFLMMVFFQVASCSDLSIVMKNYNLAKEQVERDVGFVKSFCEAFPIHISDISHFNNAAVDLKNWHSQAFINESGILVQFSFPLKVFKQNSDDEFVLVLPDDLEEVAAFFLIEVRDVSSLSGGRYQISYGKTIQLDLDSFIDFCKAEERSIKMREWGLELRPLNDLEVRGLRESLGL